MAQAAHTRLVQKVRRVYGAELALLPAGPPTHAAIEQCIMALGGQGRPLASALRVTRQLVMERLVVLDVEQLAAVEVVTQAMTALAEVTLEHALAQTRRDLDERHGEPLDEAGQAIEMWVVGMGKLGSRELNVSSDIDLIYVYEREGQTRGRDDGGGVVSAHEYFALVARGLRALIDDNTGDGFVFRMDLALRPNGNSGPPVVSLAMLEEYFLVQGREWERFAWLKSRVVAPRAGVTSGRAKALGEVVSPFVYRRYLDYGVFEGLRTLHQKIRDEANRRAAGRPERANDVKLSRGGIREIEFIVQLLQVVRGGQFPEIRTRPTLKALQRLTAAGMLPAETARRLAEAYVFLRRVEHRIQYLDDQQTHQLPTLDADLGWIAAAMGMPCTPDACALIDRLCEHREFVATEFDALLHDGRGTPRGACKGKGCSAAVPTLDGLAQNEALSPAVAERLRQLLALPRVQMLRDDARARLAKLIKRAVTITADGGAAFVAGTAFESQLGSLDGASAPAASPTAEGALGETALLRFIDWAEPLLRRESYLALLAERSEVLGRLLKLLGLARWPMSYLMRHPGVIDELADTRMAHQRFDRTAYARDLDERHQAWMRSGQADEGLLLDTLRRAHQAETFRTLVRDVEGELSVEQVADDLSALADATLDVCLRWAWQHLKSRHRDEPQFCVVAYGKLGGKELGYGSDLDIVFLYDDADERAPEVYAAFARKLITWLSLRTSAGDLYEIDTALRPNGNSGLLVTSIDAFERYQQGRGSNTAWTWEHQAITRARWCAGLAALMPRVEAVRRVVISAERDHAALRAQVVEMRDRMRQANAPRPGRFDLKHSPGGMIDVEFVVQYLVLAHSGARPELQQDAGNIALLLRAQAAGLLGAGVGQAAADAYREMRRAQHRARLDEASTTRELAELGPMAAHRDAVLALWRTVFG
jgi:glutamate-ammonia-ligase adenylyltransferase